MRVGVRWWACGRSVCVSVRGGERHGVSVGVRAGGKGWAFLPLHCRYFLPCCGGAPDEDEMHEEHAHLRCNGNVTGMERRTR